MRRTLALTFLLTSLLALAFVPLYSAPATTTAPASPPITLETGAIGGAPFTIAHPQFWNNRVLLLAHGYRAEDRPLLADLFPEHLAYRTLLDEGWMIAKTSYRRNGIIVTDAIADLDALRSHIRQRFGQPDRVLLEGESIGGLIVTLLAERDSDTPFRYDGAIAIGAALQVKENGVTLGLTLQPKIPPPLSHQPKRTRRPARLCLRHPARHPLQYPPRPLPHLPRRPRQRQPTRTPRRSPRPQRLARPRPLDPPPPTPERALLRRHPRP